jgi:hypothetical protein
MRDLRKYAKQTTVQLIVGAVVILLVVGLGLIYYFYGIGGAVSGLLCVGAGLLPILAIAGALWLIETISKRNRD